MSKRLKNNIFYEKVYCPKCSTEHVIKKIHIGKIIPCVCGIKFVITCINEKYEAWECGESK